MAIRNTRLTPNLLSAALLTALIAPGFAMAQDAGSSQSSDSQEQTASWTGQPFVDTQEP